MERPMVMNAISGRVFTDPNNLQLTTTTTTTASFSRKATIRKDASFSAYLNLEEPGTHQDDSELSIFDAQKYFNETGTDPRLNKRVSPVESGVIGLDCIPEREFPSGSRFSSASSSVDGYSSYGRNYRTRSFHATPTASSEASWNSQTGLLTNPPGAIAVSIRNPPEKRRGATRKWLFGQRCPCYGRKSVQIDENLSEPKIPSRLASSRTPNGNNLMSLERQQIPDRENANGALHDRSPRASHWAERREGAPSTQRISAEVSRFPPPGLAPPHRVLTSSARPFPDGANGFTFPILTQASSSQKVALNVVPPPAYKPPPSLQDPPRDSLEVFQPSLEPTLLAKPPAVEPQQRHSFTFPASPRARNIEDDMASDASSDLFEIESFSTQSTSYPMYSNRRDSLDEAAIFNARRINTAVPNGGGGCYGRPSVDEPVTPSVAATECYEPSEASIDWSVVTAEGFDRGSTITSYSVTTSEANYRVIMRQRDISEKAVGDGCGGGENRKGSSGNGGGLLTSCRCEKAVSVGPQPVKCVVDLEGHKGASSTLRHVGSRPPQPPLPVVGNNNNYKVPPLARSHSARLSLPFAA